MATNSDVQVELQAYLAEKNITNLFTKIVEHLLLHTPANPIQFVVQYLKENYPEETTGITIEAGPAVGTAGAVSLVGGGQKVDSDDSDYSTDEDEDDGPVDMVPMPKVSAGRRRVSVSAESVSVDKMRDMKWEKKIFPKSDEEVQQINEIIAKTIIFKALDEEQTKIIVDAMNLVEFSKDDVIIKQGDDGDKLYLVIEGEAECFVKPKEGDEKMVLTCKKDMCFGELALMYNAPRAATVKASSDIKLWALDRLTFKMIMMDSMLKKRDLYKSFIDKVKILGSLNPKEVNTITDALVPRDFEDGQKIIEQGASGDVFYIIERGDVVCTQTLTSDEAPVEVCRLSSGDYFGEIALLTDRPRQATVTSVGTVRCLTLDRKTFKRVMGPLVDILKRNISTYNNFMAQKI